MDESRAFDGVPNRPMRLFEQSFDIFNYEHKKNGMKDGI